MVYDPRPKHAGNEFYPLPHDYPDLTKKGQKVARLAAISRHDTPEHFRDSWALFRKLYLETLPDKEFYKHKLYDSPPAHYEWIEKFWRYQYNAIAAPRASAKSTVLGKELILLLLLTQPNTITTLTMASQDIRQERFDDLMTQLETNPYILNDFGQMKSPKGSGIWNHQYLKLANGAVLQGVTVDGRKRGARPHFIIMDDPEYDPDREENDTDFLKKAENLIFNQMLPMLEEDGRFLWIGTMVSRRSALWNVCMSDDPRFRYWKRRVHSQVETDEDGNTAYFWGDKWGAERVEDLKERMGEAAWQKEYQNNPVALSARILSLDPNLGTYTRNGSNIQYMTRRPDGELLANEEPWSDFLSKLGILVTVDPSISESLSSDHSAILVTGIDPSRTWWLLDLHLGNWVANNLVDKVWATASQWNASLIGVESVGLNSTFVQAMQSSYESLEAAHAPRMWPIKYPSRLSKQERIAALSARFARNAIKFPAHLRGQFPWKELWKQIEYFTMDLAMLERDDAIDSLAMVPYCPGVRGGKRIGQIDGDSLWDMLRNGVHRNPETGLPLSGSYSANDIPPDVLRDVLRNRINRGLEAQAKDKERRTSHAAEVIRKSSSNLVKPVVQ